MGEAKKLKASSVGCGWKFRWI